MSDQTVDDNSNIDVLAVLSKEEDTKGFDIEAGQSWHYPTNYPFREYQYNIIQQSLYKNTLVSLPTGLGKTFIAAVVMYNFYRWYPSGKIIFMAPTRPLVKQQVDACYNIMAIPKDVTTEITGSKLKASRNILWDKKRVFFITPQILQNDLEIIENLGSKIKCLVFDEAHRAKGNHAYCEVIRKLYPKNKYFRVLALSATPGSSMKDVFEITSNLLIAHLEVRTEESLDVSPYVFHRTLQTVVVPLGGKLEETKNAYLKVLERYVRVLVQNKVISGNCNQLTKGKIFMTMKSYQEKNKATGGGNFNEIMRTLTICITLYHAYELLIRHGLRGFLSFYEDHINKPLLRGIEEIHDILRDIQSYLGPVPNVNPLPDGSIPDVPETITFGHPKYYELGKILTDHFSIPENTNSRVIIFCEYKESVMEAYALLLKSRPVIKPKFFMGQGAMPQRVQLNVLKAFREGECNTLISTCIGEEGLDVGEVDLIVCFDINNKSPIRLVQRMGRTGRKRKGKVIILVTEGKEQEVLKECLAEKQNLATRLITSKDLRNSLYKNNPRMVPEGFNPFCEKIRMIVIESPKNKKIKTDKEEVNDRNSKRSTKTKSSDSVKEKPKPTRKRAVKEEKNLSQSSSGTIKKEKVPKKSKPTKNNSADNFKQCDLKSMFSNGLKKNTKDNGDDKMEIIDISSAPSSPAINDTLTEELFSEISAFFIINDANRSCKICDNLFSCSKLNKPTVQFDCDFELENWTDMDDNVIKSIDSDALNTFANSLDYNLYNDFDMPDCVNFAPDQSRDNISFRENSICDSSNKKITTLKNCDEKNSPCRKQQIKRNSIGAHNKSFFKNLKINQKENSLQNKNELNDDNFMDFDDFLDDTFNENLINLTKFHEKNNTQTSNSVKTMLKGISVNNSKENIKETKSENVKSPERDVSPSELKDAVEFLHLEKFEDILEPLEESLQKSQNSTPATVIYNLDDILHSRETSPILTGRVESFKLQTQEKLTQISKYGEIDFDCTENKNENFKLYNSSSSEFENNFILCRSRNNQKSNTTAAVLNKGNSGSSSEFEIDKRHTNIEAIYRQNETTINEVIAAKTLEDLNISLDLDDFHDESIVGLNNEITVAKNKLSSQQQNRETHNNRNYVITDCELPSTSQNDDINMNKMSPIISQFEKTYNGTPSQLSITQAVDFINKKKPKIATSLFKSLRSDDYSDDFCFMEMKNKQSSVALKKENCVKPSNIIKDNRYSFINSKKSEIVKSPKVNFIKRIHKIDSDSDDDFEQLPIKSSTGWISKKDVQTPVKKSASVGKGKENKVKNTSSTQNNFKVNESLLSKQNATRNFQLDRNHRKNGKRKKRKKSHDFPFIENEAQLDSEEEVSSDTTEGSDDDVLEMSFVNDETQDLGNNTMMHAEYLKSVRSPTLNCGQFKIPKNPPLRPDVFSQVPNTEDNSYLNDSFCDDDILYLTQKDDMSLLEVAEMQLEEEKKNRKRKKSKEEQPVKMKKRRIIVISSDESE